MWPLLWVGGGSQTLHGDTCFNIRVMSLSVVLVAADSCRKFAKDNAKMDAFMNTK